MKRNWKYNFAVLSFILLAAFSRLIPHPANFTAIGALAIFGAFAIPNRWLAFTAPLLAMWLSDVLLNNFMLHQPQGFMWFGQGFVWIYAGVVAHTVATWFVMPKFKTISLALTSMIGALLFFLLSNFGVWFQFDMYPSTFDGLMLCYAAAIPFFGNVLASNLLFSGVLFGSYFLLEKKTNVFETA